MPSLLSLFIFSHAVFTSIYIYILLFISQILIPGFMTLSILVLDTWFLISNVPHTPMSVSICSTPSETFSRDSKLEIRPLLPAGQTYLLQPHTVEETSCFSPISMTGEGPEGKSMVSGFYFLCTLTFFQMSNNKHLLLLFIIFKDRIFIIDILGFLL